MKELAYPFDAEKILNRKKTLRRLLLVDSLNRFVEKKIAILGGETAQNIKLILVY